MSIFKKSDPKTRRRNVVNSGTPQAFSYYAKRSEQEVNTGRQASYDKPATKRSRNLRLWLNQAGLIIATIVIAACFVNILRLSNNPKIEPLASNAGKYFLRNSSVYQQAVSKLLASSLSNSNKITVNTDDVSNKLKQEFPELSDAAITLPLIGHRPIIYIQPTMPVFVMTANDGQAFVIDQNGRALGSAGSVPQLKKFNLPTVQDKSGIAIKPNETALPADNVSFVYTVVGQLKAHHIGISSMILPPAASELDVQLADHYTVKYNIHNTDANQQVGTFLAVRQKLKASNITPADYIDVRVDGRAYYK